MSRETYSSRWSAGCAGPAEMRRDRHARVASTFTRLYLCKKPAPRTRFEDARSLTHSRACPPLAEGAGKTFDTLRFESAREDAIRDAGSVVHERARLAREREDAPGGIARKRAHRVARRVAHGLHWLSRIGEIDFVDALMGGGFALRNPNAVSSCGCGQSFKTADQSGTAKACAH